MKTFQIILATAAVLSALPAAASTTSRSASACAKAFAEQVAAERHRAPSYRVDYVSPGAGSILSAYYSSRYTFDLHARDSKSGEAVAHATCVTNRSGEVISLHVDAVGAEAARLAARL